MKNIGLKLIISELEGFSPYEILSPEPNGQG